MLIADTPISSLAPAQRVSSTDAELVRACLDGNEAAWAALIDRYKHLIYGAAIRGGASPNESVDIFLGVCRQLFSELPHLRRVESLRAWLLNAAMHQLYELRMQRRQSAESLDDVEQPVAGELATLPPAVLEALNRDQRVRDAVEQLPDRCGRLVQLLFHEHPPRPYSSVARQLGLASGAIGFIRGRCLTQLARSLRAGVRR